ncbi:hypothetical protein FACS1894158_08790 [Betaproteobacteria bacterium]|nr:hypothetical protein FACS1894158_08790 [Betaproteobacteria bacterium]
MRRSLLIRFRGNGGTSGSILGAIENNAELVFNRSDTYIHTGDISGTGTLSQSSFGILNLNGNVTQGEVSLYNGTLNIAAGNTVTTSGLFTVADGATLGLNLGGSAVRPISAGGDFNINTGATGTTLNIIGYMGGTAAPIIHSDTAINGNFTNLLVNGAAQSLASYLSVSAVKSTDGKDLLLDGALAWNRADNAHGTFDIASAAHRRQQLHRRHRHQHRHPANR